MKMKKLLSTVISTALVLTTLVMPITAKADNNRYCGAVGNEQNVTWSYDNGTLTISGTGAMADYDDVSPWYDDYSESIEKIIISEGITRIGDAAFEDCSNLSNVEFENLETSKLESIGNYAFYGCTRLTSITLPSGAEYDQDSFPQNTNISIDGSGALPENACGLNATYKIENGTLTISGTGSIYDYSDYPDYSDYLAPWYNSGANITKLVIENGITSIGTGAFLGLAHLTDVTLPNTLTSIGNKAFYQCTRLSSLTIPSGVTTIGEKAFYQLGQAVTVESVEVALPDTVTSVASDAFLYCDKVHITYTGKNQAVANTLDESGAGSVVATEFEGEKITVSNTYESGTVEDNSVTTETIAFTADEHDGGATGFVTAINNKTKKTQVTINHITWKVTASDGTKKKYTSTSNDFTAFNLLPSDDTTFVIFVVSNLIDAGAKVVAEVD